MMFNADDLKKMLSDVLDVFLDALTAYNTSAFGYGEYEDRREFYID